MRRHVLGRTQRDVELHGFCESSGQVKPIARCFCYSHVSLGMFVGEEMSTCADEEFFNSLFRTFFLFIVIKSLLQWLLGQLKWK